MRDPELFAQPAIVAVTIELGSNYMLLPVRRPSVNLMASSGLSYLHVLAPFPALAPLQITVC